MVSNQEEQFDYMVKMLDLDKEKLKEFYTSMFGIDKQGNINWPAIVDSGKMYIDPSSFCSNCSNLVTHDRYCTQCGKRNKEYHVNK